MTRAESGIVRRLPLGTTLLGHYNANIHFPFLAFVVLLGVSSMAPAQADSRTSIMAPPSQQYCPVTPEERIDPSVFTEYNHQRVYFCCGKCEKRFERNPVRYAAQLASAGTELSSSSKDSEQQHEHDDEQVASQSRAASERGENHGQFDEADPSAAEHNHKEHGSGGGARWVTWIGGFHPAMVNFPIGVLVAGALAELLYMLRRREIFDYAARYCIVFASFTGVVAAALGWLFAGLRLTDGDAILAIHRWIGTAAAILLAALIVVSERAHRAPGAPRLLYRICLFGSAVLVLTTGFFGGAMVYGLDHYVP